MATVFTIEGVSVWHLYPWPLFMIAYAFACLLIVFPGLSRIWPFSSFSFMPKRGRWNGFLTLAFVSAIAVPHFLMTSSALQSAQSRLVNGEFEIHVLPFDDQDEAQEFLGQAVPGKTLVFDGRPYELPGGLHGAVTFPARLRGVLREGEDYRLFVSGDEILRIERLDRFTGQRHSIPAPQSG